MIDGPKFSWDDEFLDRELDQALASYTLATPRSGFEERLKVRLEAEGGHRRWALPAWPWAWAGAAAVAAVAGILVLAPHPHVSNAPPGLAEVPHSVSPEKHNSDPKGPVDSAGSYAGVKPPTHRTRVAGNAKEPVHGEVSAIDEVSYQEMRAASHPAPEEPLTQQERLLLRFVHRGDPQVMAMLNPEVREKQEAQNEAEFHQWVEQSMKGERE